MEWTHVEKWKDKLHVCIRCGYCFEHCHLFKISGWETDTPRGKLITLFGMMTGELEPTEYAAEKIFECYMCKRCDATCSAKVNITEILTDAKRDLLAAGFDVYGTTSHTDDEKCCRCQICVSACRHEARSYDTENDRIVVDRVKCQSCGCCVAACPTGAAYSYSGYGLSQQELLDEVVEFLGG